VHYAGDVYTRMQDARAIVDASAAADKTLVVVRNADHYGKPIRDGAAGGQRIAEGTDAVVSWMTGRFPPDGK
jgi:hypothetical protein